MISNIGLRFLQFQNRDLRDSRLILNLSLLDPDTRHRGILPRRFEGVGSWLLKTREFRRWKDGEGGVLFCPGNPGVGKTYLR